MPFFDYSRLPYGDWTAHLEKLYQENPNREVLIRVFWGDHETLKGVRDFHTKPRLKIEKVCSLAQSLKIPLHVSFGFNEEKRSFPSWTFPMNPRSVVPVAKPEELISSWEFVSFPSFRNQEVRTGFLSFLKESLSMLTLYLPPEGSVQNISFDWGVLRSDSSPIEPSFIEMEFLNRYGSIEKFNALFQTNFNNFQSVSKPVGLKTILNKRPWLAFWEYKSLKEKSFALWENEIQMVFKEAGLSWRLTPDSLSQQNTANSLVIDDTLLDLNADQTSFTPHLIQGEVDGNALRVFRVAEMLKIEAAQKSERLEWLSTWSPTDQTKACVVVCSKFMPHRSFLVLSQFMESGGTVFFPFGVPIWDENMENLKWNNSRIGSVSLRPVEENLYEKLKGLAP